MRDILNKYQSGEKVFWLGSALLLFPYLIWLLFAKSSYILIHDNLDCEFMYIKTILGSGNVLGHDLKGTIPELMNGIPRSLFRSGYNFTFVLFYIFEDVYAYIINHFIVHFIGFSGMYFLLKRYFVKDNDWVVLAVSLCFGLLCYFFTSFGIAVSGQALFLYSSLNFMNNRNAWYDWIILLLFPFMSFIVATIPFYFPLLLLVVIFKIKEGQKVSLLFFLVMGLVSLISLLIEFNLVYSTIMGEYVSHRVEWNPFMLKGLPSINQFFSEIKIDLWKTRQHSGEFHPFLIIGTLLVTSFGFKLKLPKLGRLILWLIVFLHIWVAFNLTFEYLFAEKFTILKIFHTKRFYLILPFLWLLLFSLILNSLDFKKMKQVLTGGVAFCLVLGSIIISNGEITHNIRILLKGATYQPTYEQFFDKELFSEIKSDLGDNEVRDNFVLSVGLYSTIAQYNGFNVLDGYQNNYLLSYKHQFRKIISQELNKNKDLESYFDNWGSRCYALSSELGRKFIVPKSENRTLNNYELNIDEFKKLNGKYIISAVKIKNPETHRLNLMKIYDRNDSYYRVYLYSVM